MAVSLKKESQILIHAFNTAAYDWTISLCPLPKAGQPNVSCNSSAAYSDTENHADHCFQKHNHPTMAHSSELFLIRVWLCCSEERQKQIVGISERTKAVKKLSRCPCMTTGQPMILSQNLIFAKFSTNIIALFMAKYIFFMFYWSMFKNLYFPTLTGLKEFSQYFYFWRQSFLRCMCNISLVYKTLLLAAELLP